MVLPVMMVMLAMLNVDDIGQKDDDFENRLRKTTKGHARTSLNPRKLS